MTVDGELLTKLSTAPRIRLRLVGSSELKSEWDHPVAGCMVCGKLPAMSQGQFPNEQSESGEFDRQEDAFRDNVSADPAAAHPAAPGRYHLYLSLACPWACRALLARNLMGLAEAIGVTVVDPVRDEKGWAFRDGHGHTTDPVNGFAHLAEAYEATLPGYDGRVTVPVLWDKEKGKIVNNSEDDICRMFHDAFADYRRGEADWFPADLAGEQEELSGFIYETINNGVYRAGFATKQAVYEKAAAGVFKALDEMEARLQDRRYLFGDRVVESDWRLFCTTIRFDPVYHGHFKCNRKRIADYPNLWRHLKDLYQWPGVADTVDFDHIKRHYYMTHDEINPTRIVPIGPDMRLAD